MKLIDCIHEFDNYRPVSDTDSEHKILKRIRNWRDRELLATDWTMISDAATDKAAWAEYRQALRDLPAQSDIPEEIELPVRPA
jgi:hypothetical protein